MADLTLQEVRSKYPQYKDMSDQQLVEGLHKKYYSDMPIEDFQKKVGYSPVKSPQPMQPQEQPTKYGLASNIAGSIAEPLAKIGTSMVAGPVSDIAGLAAIPAHALGLTKQMPEAVQSGVRQALTYQPRTEAGKTVTGALEYIPQKYGEAVKSLGEKVSGEEPAYTPKGIAGSLIKGIGEQAPTLIGAKYASPARIAAKAEKELIKSGENAVLDATRAQSQKAGFITPVEGHGIKNMAAGLAGRAKVDKWISAKNQEHGTRLLAQDLGVPDGVALSDDTFKQLKNDAYSAYDNMVKAVPSLKSTTEYKTNLNDSIKRIESGLRYDSETYKPLIPSLRLLRSYAKKDIHDPTQALNAIKELRKQSKSDFLNDRNEIGTAKLGIANQLEGVFEKNLEQTGKSELLNNFKQARAQLAKVNVAERVVNPATGVADLQKIAALSKKNRYTGNLKVISDFAQAFPKAAQLSKESAPTVSVFDGLFAAGAMASGYPLLAAGELTGRLAVPQLAARGMLQQRPGLKIPPKVPATAGYAFTESEIPPKP